MKKFKKMVLCAVSLSLIAGMFGCIPGIPSGDPNRIEYQHGVVDIKLLGDATVIMENSNSKHNYLGWPTVVRMQDDRIIVGASGLRLDHLDPFGKGVIAVSKDKGASYSALTIAIDSMLDDRDVGLTPFGENGLIVTSFSNDPDWQLSVDPNGDDPYKQGYVDSLNPLDVYKHVGSKFVISNDGGATFSDIYRAPVTSPHGPAVCANGKILWIGNRITSDKQAEKKWSIPVGASSDDLFIYELDPATGEMTYVGMINTSDTIEGIACEPYMVEAPDGTLICHIRVDGCSGLEGSQLYQSESHDGGKTWTTPHHLTAGAPAHILVHSSGALISVYGYRLAPTGVRCMVSWDNGKTWDMDHQLYVGSTTDLGYPSTCELPDGTLLTVWYAAPEAGAPTVVMQQKWRIS